MIKLGLIGLSPANGHPYSFSAIINGFDDAGMKASGWDGIYNYLKQADPAEIGFDNAVISHVWTQDPEITRSICRASNIAHAVSAAQDMIGHVDGVILARDDYQAHMDMAKPFLEAGLFVFIDKPLTLDTEELAWFTPYLKSGKLMSCSGLRYATELDVLRGNPAANIGELRAIQCGVINGWEKYGIHMLDAAFGVYPDLQPKSVTRHFGEAEIFSIEMVGGSYFSIICLGNKAPVFSLNFLGETGSFHAQISNNFGAFRRTMLKFVEQIETGQPVIPWSETLRTLKILIAGCELEKGETTASI